jgi:3-oxoacyl-[acyl-carrier protein] reductase
MVQPHYGKTLIRDGGWDLESLDRHFAQQLQGEFGALGMMGKPYPFHRGVTESAPAQKGE